MRRLPQDVVSWGATNAGQTTVPSGLTNVAAIGAGGARILAVGNGVVIAWGKDTNGQATALEHLSHLVAVAADD